MPFDTGDQTTVKRDLDEAYRLKEENLKDNFNNVSKNYQSILQDLKSQILLNEKLLTEVKERLCSETKQAKEILSNTIGDLQQEIEDKKAISLSLTKEIQSKQNQLKDDYDLYHRLITEFNVRKMVFEEKMDGYDGLVLQLNSDRSVLDGEKRLLLSAQDNLKKDIEKFENEKSAFFDMCVKSNKTIEEQWAAIKAEIAKLLEENNRLDKLSKEIEFQRVQADSVLKRIKEVEADEKQLKKDRFELEKDREETSIWRNKINELNNQSILRQRALDKRESNLNQREKIVKSAEQIAVG